MDAEKGCKFKEDDGYLPKIKINKEDYKFLKLEEPETKPDFVIGLFQLAGTDKLDSKYKDKIKNIDAIKRKDDIQDNDNMKEKSFLKLKKEGDINGYVSNQLLSICKSEKLINDMEYNGLEPRPLENFPDYLDGDFDHPQVQVLHLSESRQIKKKKRSKPKNVDKSKMFLCSQCNYRSQSRKNFAAHLHVHLRVHSARGKLECAHCQYRTCKKSTLTKHLTTHGVYDKEDKEAYTCSYCGSQFKHRYNLIRHCKSGHPHHPDKSRPFKCSSCAVAYGTCYELNRHLLTHSRERPYECAHCDYATTRRYVLIEHLLRHERNTDSKPHKRKATVSREERGPNKRADGVKTIKDLKLHTVEVEDKYPFRCANCSYRTSKHSLLKYHIIGRHTREPVFECSTCDYSTFRREDLTKHKRSKKHDIFSCQHCDFTCFKYLLIEKHMKTHFIY